MAFLKEHNSDLSIVGLFLEAIFYMEITSARLMAFLEEHNSDLSRVGLFLEAIFQIEQFLCVCGETG